jgi:molybdopterin synthase catalytic subunit/molybdopterin converting factor small subunit
MLITVLLFASYRDLLKTNRIMLEVPEPSKIADVKKVMAAHYPVITGLLPHALVSINQQYAFDEDLILPGAEVAFFPPVSGGSRTPTILKITNDPLDLDELVAQITQVTTGAVCVFSGIVRGQTNHGNAHQTIALEYEAYIPMAEAKLGQVAEEIRTRWPAVAGIAIVQRIGRLEPMTPTVLIACAASHRDTGVFEAARYGIDRLKEIVPVWKKETGPNGEIWVEGYYHPHPGD